jgi:ribosomal protein L11 methylase PrmA
MITLILPTLVGASCGRLILSGILDTQKDTVLTRLHELGVSEPDVTSEGEWVCIVG